MKKNCSNNFDSSVESDTLETADAVARAAHIWIRSLCLSEMQSEDERHALAGGLVAGLSERLILTPRVQQLIAYIYLLLDNEGGQALAMSRLLLDQHVPPSKLHAYERGRVEAGEIVEMLAFHDQKNRSR